MGRMRTAAWRWAGRLAADQQGDLVQTLGIMMIFLILLVGVAGVAQAMAPQVGQQIVQGFQCTIGNVFGGRPTFC